ncbi:MAG TPA: phasin family protein [Burkholderiales bacterium]
MQPQSMQTQFLDIYRTGLKTTADMMTASLESAQQLQRQQLDALHSVFDEQVKSVRELSEVKSVDELVALQTRLTGSQLERAMDFWAQMWRAVGDNRMAITPVSASASVASAVRDVAQQAQQESRKHQERKTA